MKELFTLTKVMLSEKKAILLAILLGFLAAISSVGLLGTGGYLISQSALHPPLYTLTLTILFVRFFGLSRAASRYAERYFSHKATFSILGKLRVYFYDKIEPLAPALFSSYRSGDLLSRVVADVERLQYFFLRVFYPPLVMIVVFITTGIVIYTFSIFMAFVLLFGLVIVGFVIPFIFTYLTENIGYHLRQKRSLISVQITEFLFGFTDLRTNRRLKDKQSDIARTSKELIEEQEKDGMLAAKGESISLSAAFVIAWVMLVVGVTFVESGVLNGVFLAMLVLMTLTVFEVATPMAVIPGHLEESRVAARRLFQLTKHQTDVEEDFSSTEVPTTPVKITFSDVAFSYPNAERLALNKITFELEAKEKIAIVGASGSGKSSVLNLLLKFYKKFDGDISLGNFQLKNISEEDARRFFGVVAQENHFFNDTVRGNLLVAKPDASDEELQFVLNEMSLHHLQLDTVLSERGFSISGGERQRLAIARMVLKDAPILLMDEPTTGLDSITEQEVLSFLWPKVEGKSVIYITHRLVGLEKMDKIIVFDKSKIVEEGTYEQLMKVKGYFYQLKQLEKEKIG
ncbi:thiol reductant ABC exporter subunit CydC [Anaerobacillus alkalidiazotrophicus]|uniref:Thiol reductant ABC exporter subunit CydC n=1 Tax=Anaerobacillus alkalidiazotrophicus TaxID=472963 RepID=A0A1S2M6D5_9BACI|nr:thiol reductant ABC exporter subunit CydC [Anaerobacillus alkalidiazotrophicus]OIJ20080.1 thiol reductant ABC exporter subunit CydC [Anaerobacillus alkalidiazotrophicus]